MKILSELEKQILKEAYPQLSFNDDLDIERYFELRKIGRMNEAIAIYNNVLRRKYPDDDLRVQLLSFYRVKDPRFQVLLTENLAHLAENIIKRLTQVITYITNKIMALKPNDIFTMIQTCEALVSAISSDRFVSISETEKYARFAEILNFRPNEMKQAAELIRLYVTDNISSVRDFKNEQAEQKRLEYSKKQKYIPQRTFDFSKINFSKEQEKAILLPKHITRTEDKVLAYIMQYWHFAFNGQFENLVLMYSRKYKTDHYNVFMAIKTARIRNWKDEELIQAVLSNVVSGYYYSISGDIYLQRNWARIKPNLMAGTAKPLLIEAPKVKLTVVSPTVVLTDKPEKAKSIEVVTSKTEDKPKPIKENNIIYEPTVSEKEMQEAQKKQAQKYKQLKEAEAKWSKDATKNIRKNAKKYAEQQQKFLQSEKKFSTQKVTGTVKTQTKPLTAKSNQTENEKIKIQKEKEARIIASEYRKAEQEKNREIAKIAKEKAKSEALRKKELEKQVKLKLEKEAAQKAKQEELFAKKTEKQRLAQELKERKRIEAENKKRERENAKRQRDLAKQEKKAKSKPNIFIPDKTGFVDMSKTNSIKQMIRRATGKSYVLYKDVFFKSVRPAIREILHRSSRQKKSVFSTNQNMAENIIYVFLERNYDNPYQNWGESEAKFQVEQLGFNVDKIEPIITHWVKTELK